MKTGNSYKVRFKPVDDNGISIQFEVETATSEEAIDLAINELENRDMLEEYAFEGVYQAKAEKGE